MFENISLLWIIGPALIITIIAGRVYKARTKTSINKSEKFIIDFKVTLLQMCFLLSVLWLCMPSTPSLSTFGYPDDIDSINSPQKVLELLQTYNRAIVRTTEVLHWALFFITIALANFAAILPTVYKNTFLNQI